MRKIEVVVMKDPGAARPTFCSGHGSTDRTAAALGLGGAVSSVAGRLVLRDGGCPRCTADALAAGRAQLAPEGINALGKPVPLDDLRDHGTAQEREFVSMLQAGADAAGAADLDALLRALRRAQARPGSPETVELREALRALLGPPSAPCCAPAVPATSGVCGPVRRWRMAS